MVSKAELIENFKKAFQKKGRLHERSITNPGRDWFLGLGIALVILGVSGWWGYYTFNLHQDHEDRSDEDMLSQEKKTVSQYRASLVEQALDLFAKREVVLQEELASLYVEQEVLEEVVPTEDLEEDVQVAASSTEQMNEQSTTTTEVIMIE